MGVEIAVGIAIGAAVGAIGGAASGGGDKIWKGALVGAVSGAVTAGVGSWAGAGAGGWAGAAGGALAGGAGGLTAGVLGTALNGGNRTDYLKSGLFGGLSGAAMGGLMGGLSGGPSNGEMADTIAQGTPQEAYASGGDNMWPGVDYGTSASGVADVGTAGGTAAIDPTISSVPQPTTTPLIDTSTTTPTLSDTVTTAANNQYAAAPTNTMTDIAGSSAIPQELSGGVSTSTTPQTEYSMFGGDTVTTPQPQTQTEYAMFGGDVAPKPTEQTSSGFWDKLFTPSKTSTGTKGMNLQDYMKMQGMGSLMSGGVKTMGALATAGETSANRQNLMDLYNQQQQQNQYYGNKLQATYDNPEEYLNSPEALATRQLAMQKLLAQNAAAGRRTAGLPMQNQLMMNQLTNLANYRRGIPQTNYTASGALYDKAAQYSPTGDITTGLASMFTPMSMYALGSYL